MSHPITNVQCNNEIIQVKMNNVEKNSLFISEIFEIISHCEVNVDMISQVMLEEETRIDFTCHQEDQKKLNKAIELIKEKHPRIHFYQSRNVAKVKVHGRQMKEEVGVASKMFKLFGELQVPLYQVTTSETSISYVIPKEFSKEVEAKIKEEFSLEEK